MALVMCGVMAAADSVPFSHAQETAGKKDSGAETKKIEEEPLNRLVAGLYNAFVKGGNADAAFSALERRGVEGVRALLVYSSDITSWNVRARVDQWIAARARTDSAVLQFLVDSLSSEYLGDHAARILPNGGAGAAEHVLSAMSSGLEPGRNGATMNAADKKRVVDRAKQVLCLLPSEYAVNIVSQRFQREPTGLHEFKEPTAFGVNMAYVLCTRSEGIEELAGIVRKQHTERIGRSILRGMKLVLDEAGDNLLSDNQGGDTVGKCWRGLFAAFNAAPEWRDSVGPLEKQFEQISKCRRERMEKLRKKQPEKKISYLRSMSPSSFEYVAIMESMENTRSAVIRPFSDKRARKDSFIDRKTTSIRARSEFARHRMES